ncbi:MAG: NAD(P)/FAD-dependent oxidoreductase [Dehalococcoidales bacterium]
MAATVDVIVIGAGPAGSAAAKRCAQKGMDTLLLEKADLPRDKVCTGMLMGPLAQSLVREEFGEIPPEVRCHPPDVKGHVFCVPGIGQQKLEHSCPLTWRRKLDFWLNQQAVAAGAKLSPGTKIITMRPDNDGFQVLIEQGEDRDMLKTRYIIGADGGNSMTREFLFPTMEVSYGHVYQECYQLPSSLETGYVYWFHPLEFSPAFASAHYKDETLVIDVSGSIGQLQELRAWFREYLSREYGFDLNAKPVWQGGCIEPVLHRQLFDGSFLPASGNALLIGDAAGLLMPVSSEGIGAAIKSGLAAAKAIGKALQSDGVAAEIYLDSLKTTLDVYRELAQGFKEIIAEAKAGGGRLPQVLVQAYQATLRQF